MRTRGSGPGEHATERAFVALFERTSHRVYGYVRRHCEDADCDDFIFRVPNRGDYNSYKVHQKKSLLGQAAPDATASLARLCLLFPTKDEFDALREKAPAIVEDLGEDLVEAAACGLSVREGKP